MSDDVPDVVCYLSCPFCDASTQEIFVEQFALFWRAVCKTCDAHGLPRRTPDEARERWNIRAADQYMEHET